MYTARYTCNTVASAERDRVDRAGTRRKEKKKDPLNLNFFGEKKKEEDEKVARVLWRGEAHSCATAAAACWPPQGSLLIERFVRIHTHITFPAFLFQITAASTQLPSSFSNPIWVLGGCPPQFFFQTWRRIKSFQRYFIRNFFYFWNAPAREKRTAMNSIWYSRLLGAKQMGGCV